MEVKIIESRIKSTVLEIYDGEELWRKVDKFLFIKHIGNMLRFSDIRNEFAELEKKVAYHYCLRRLSKSAISPYRLKKSLYQKGISEEAALDALSKLAPYINEEEFLESAVKSFIRRGKGRQWIVEKLRREEGFSKEEICRVLSHTENQEGEREAAITLIQKKYRGGVDSNELKIKAYRLLRSRGFSNEIALEALKQRENVDF